VPSCQGDKIYDISRELLYSPFQGPKCPSNAFFKAYFSTFLANFKWLVWSDPTELGLQMDYELDVAEDMLEGRLEKEIKPMSATG